MKMYSFNSHILKSNVSDILKLKENYDNMELLLNLIKYDEYQRKICVDLKMISILLGLQAGYTKYPCFLCLWDSRADKPHYSQQEWPIRYKLKPGNHNVKLIPLVNSNNILLPLLHIKIELLKYFIKALNKEGNFFIHLKNIFPHVSDAKLMAGIFSGPHIR